MNEKLNITENNTELNALDEAKEQNEFSKEAEYQEFSQALADINAELIAEAEALGNAQLTEQSKVDKNEECLIDCGAKVEDSAVVDEAQGEKKNPCDEEKRPSIDEEKSRYKEYRLHKIFSKINYDLSSPSLKSSEIRDKINAGTVSAFNCYMLLTSKIKAVKRQLKDKADLGAVVGLGESTYLAKKWEIRQARWAGAKEIEYNVPLSAVKEGKKRILIKELCGLKRVAGAKVKFKIALDALAFDSTEFNFALSCAISAKPKAIVVKNYSAESFKYLLDVVKGCLGKYEIELSSRLNSSAEITSLMEIGVDRFNVENALELAELIKQE